MAALTINGLTVPIKADTAQEALREIGELALAFDGTLRRSRLTSKRDVSFDTYLQAGADAFAWEQLLRGLGETWHFENSYYGSKGTGTSDKLSSTFATVVSGGGLFGTYGLELTANTPAPYVEYTLTASTNWCVHVWRKVGAGAWENYIVTSAGKKWVDGVRNDAATTTWLTESSGVFTLTGDTGTTHYFDDLVILPFLPLDAWPETWGVAVAAFSDLPALTAAGDLVPEASTRTVIGSVDTGRPRYAYASGSNAIHRELSVTLQEK